MHVTEFTILRHKPPWVGIRLNLLRVMLGGAKSLRQRHATSRAVMLCFRQSIRTAVPMQTMAPTKRHFNTVDMRRYQMYKLK